jgi:putative DNA primase/helicase
VLDVVMAMRQPGDYEPQDGARFEIHFEKARGLFSNDAEPIEAP